MVEIRGATPGDIDACAAVLAQAFQDDPGAIHFEPDAARRRVVLPPFFRTFVAASLSEQGDLVVMGDPVEGIASWFGPDRHGPSEEAMLAHGYREVLRLLGQAAADRHLAMIDVIEREHERLTDGPHLRLEFFGVSPGRQGSGLGSRLIEHGHQRADALAVPCYLETFSAANVGYYGRRGYAVAGEYLLDGGMPGWGMIRLHADGTA